MSTSFTMENSDVPNVADDVDTNSYIESSNSEATRLNPHQLLPAAATANAGSDVGAPIQPNNTAAAAPGKAPQDRSRPSKYSNLSVGEEVNAKVLPTRNNPLYNTKVALDRLSQYPSLRICGEGKYYVSMKSTVIEKHEKQVFKKRNGKTVPIVRSENLGPIESVFCHFCEDVLSITRAKTLPLTSQGERHLIWVGRAKAKHILKFLKGNGCYVVNRFPGDVFLKDKQVMGTTLRRHMLERQNRCSWLCGSPVDDLLVDEDEEQDDSVTFRICRHMVQSMQTNSDGCDDANCFNYGRELCKHFDIFIPEVQSFSLFNSLQDFSNRLSGDLKGQMFVCKPSYLYKGLGFRFFRRGAEFEEFYHMTYGKETSRHDFLVQRVVDNPYLFEGRKVDIRAFLLIVTLRHRRVVAFVNPGFCRVASEEYTIGQSGSSDEDGDDGTGSGADSGKMKLRDLIEKRAKDLELNMKMLVCPYISAEERADRAKRTEQHRLFTDQEDRSKELDEVFRDESLLARIKRQIRHIGNRLAAGIEHRIWDAYGCYQIFSMDLCVDEGEKVWLLEVNSHAMSEVDLLSPTQRAVVPAVLMEALGLVSECMFKSMHDLRLRKSPSDEFKNTSFLFMQNFKMVFSTLTTRRTNYLPPRQPKDNGPPFYERITTVDNLLLKAARRRRAYEELKRRVHEQKLRLKKKRAAKNEEES